ncbi:ankyrin [Aspergillus affinis]|uniref:ankyrin n=1 Tax=Aspergillus affinis TaxID=1070780 RepID=UPI0022FE9349|nr:ankyrin [Aspergillus affinis]KAI9034857.1 ankyrin [Aspergillus affinis]
MGLESQSVEVLTNILQYLSLRTVINMRLVSRFFDDLILVNMSHFKRLSQDLSDALVSKLLYRKIFDDQVLFARVKRVAMHANLTMSKFNDKPCGTLRLLDCLCDALTFYCGREWVIKHMRHPLDWTDEWGDDETMVLAAWFGRSRTVQGLLASGRNINLRHKYLGSLMYAAAFNDDGDLTDILIEREMNLQYSEGAYGDPLQLAAYRGSATVVEYLLYSGLTLLANAISVGYGPFGSPLGAAAAAGHAEIIGTLAFSMQSSEIVGPNSKTPLHYAARHGHAKVVTELLVTEADASLTDDDDNTALEVAAREGHVDVVNAFLDGLPYTSIETADSTIHDHMALQYAAWFGHKDVVQVLVDRSLGRSYTCNGDLPPAIFCAALRDHFQIVDILLAYDRDEIDFFGTPMPHTLLTRLVESGSVRMIQHILASGVDVNERDANQDTVLHVACRFARPLVVQALLENKDLEPNRVDADGSTALDIALHEGCHDIVAMLTADDRVIDDFGLDWQVRSAG